MSLSAQTVQALPPRPLYASTQLRTLGEAFAFVKDTKAKLVSREYAIRFVCVCASG